MVENRKIDTFLMMEERKIDRLDNSDKLKCTNRKTDTLFLYFTVLTATLLILVGGTTLVWSSPAIMKLKSNYTAINPLGRPIQTIEISLLVGIPSITSILGGLFLPKLADMIGRKKGLYFLGFCFLFSMVCTAFSDDITLFIIFNAITSNVYAGVWSLLPIYLTEICEDHNRAKFGCLMAVCLPLGQLTSYIVGPLFSIRDFTLIIVSPMVPFLILFLLAPESPVYSLAIGRRDECFNTLKKLRYNKTVEELEKDLEKISCSLVIQTDKKSKFLTLFNTKEGRLGIILAMIPMLVQYLSGVPVVMSLLAPIFNDTGTLSGNTIAIIVGVVKVVIFAFTSLVIERTGRRPMLLISSAGTGIPASVLGLYFYLKYINSPIIFQLEFLPLFSVIIYIIMYSIGLGSIPVAIMSELFPYELRPYGVGIVTTTVGLFLSAISFSYPLLAEYIGTHWCLWIFGINSFLGCIFMYFILPETKGKSVVEIQQILKDY